jgi:lysine 2,3-aminomutase
MNKLTYLDQIAITVRAHKLLKELLKENPRLEEIMRSSKNETEAIHGLREWVEPELRKNPAAWHFYMGKQHDHQTFQQLKWKDYAAIRCSITLIMPAKNTSTRILAGKSQLRTP